jgi:hypothetical protein
MRLRSREEVAGAGRNLTDRGEDITAELEKFRNSKRTRDEGRRRRLEELGIPPTLPRPSPTSDERGLQERPLQERPRREELMRADDGPRIQQLEQEAVEPQEEQEEETVALDREGALESVKLAVGSLREFEGICTPVRRSVNAGARELFEARGDVENSRKESARRLLDSAASHLDDAANKAQQGADQLAAAAYWVKDARTEAGQLEDQERPVPEAEDSPVRVVAWSRESARDFLQECAVAAGAVTFRTTFFGLHLAPAEMLGICRVGRRRAPTVESVRFTGVPEELLKRVRERPRSGPTREIVEEFLAGR